MFVVIFDCDFEGFMGCGFIMNGFVKVLYRFIEIFDLFDKFDFGGKYLKCFIFLFLCFFIKCRWCFNYGFFYVFFVEFFIYIVSNLLDIEGIFFIRNIIGISYL